MGLGTPPPKVLHVDMRHLDPSDVWFLDPPSLVRLAAFTKGRPVPANEVGFGVLLLARRCRGATVPRARRLASGA